MIVHSEWKGNGFFEGKSESGHAIEFDADPAHEQGPGPMEAVLMALCACTSVDVVSILEKKREPLLGLRVTATATQAGAAPRIFTAIKLTYEVSGRVSPKAVEDAVALSKGKYCSVGRMLEKAAPIECEVVFAGDGQEP